MRSTIWTIGVSSAALLLQGILAQFPPKPEGLTILQSKFHKGVTISYKQADVCETTEGVRSYSGYVHLPPGSVSEDGESQDYPINTFFWFFEARNKPINAPLSIWMNGGPGGSSLIGALAENGPCFIGNDSNSTIPNPWSWNNDVSMLYIDEPNQVGFSYDSLFNGTKDLITGEITLDDFADGSIPEQNNTFLVGTFPSGNITHTANSTQHAARALWHFAQTWFEEFPFYKPHDEKISIWTESYGGKYGPDFMAYFVEQNEKIANGTITGPGTHYIHVDTLGIINGCVDQVVGGVPGYMHMAYNNTYGIEAINKTFYEYILNEWEKENGLKDLYHECRRKVAAGDVEDVFWECLEAMNITNELYIHPYRASNHGWYDITHPLADPFPYSYWQVFLNQPWVQSALGARTNHSMSSSAVAEAFHLTADHAKGGHLSHLSYALSRGVRVALVYGDRDFACNWIGGEQASLAIDFADKDTFAAAGYAPILLGEGTTGGLVRQAGNLSFSRVFQAGHMVPGYQPRAAFDIFARAMSGRDVATGTRVAGDGYASEGPSDSWAVKNEILPPPPPECYVLAPGTCEEGVYEAVKEGRAVVKDWIVVGVEADEVVGGMREMNEAQQRLGGKTGVE